jgi:hypothetical protein
MPQTDPTLAQESFVNQNIYDKPGDHHRQALLVFARDYLQSVLDIEGDLEIERKTLTYKSDFSLSAAFEIFSRSF